MSQSLGGVSNMQASQDMYQVPCHCTTQTMIPDSRVTILATLMHVKHAKMLSQRPEAKPPACKMKIGVGGGCGVVFSAGS